MIYGGEIYQDGDFWFYYDKLAKTFVICKDGLVCSNIIGHASTYEQAKESIEWHKQMGEKYENT